MTWKILIQAFSGVLGKVLEVVTPELRKMVESFLKDLYQKAKATQNPWDDFLVELLAVVLGIKLD